MIRRLRESREIAKHLRQVLLKNGEMADALYEFEMLEHLDYWYDGLQKDNDAFVFAITEREGDVAMVLIEADKTIYVNEAARKKLKELWLQTYKRNMITFIPMIVRDLLNGFISVTGVKVRDPNLEDI